MARTRKDQKGYVGAFRKRKERLKQAYLRFKNPRYLSIYPFDEFCPKCKSEIFEDGIALACPSCGWDSIDSKLEFLDAA